MLVPTLAVNLTLPFLFLYSETGALCAMKEVDLNPDDPKSAECIKQLEQVSPNVLHIAYKPKIGRYIVKYEKHGQKKIF